MALKLDYLVNILVKLVVFSENNVLWKKTQNHLEYAGVLYFQHGIFKIN